MVMENTGSCFMFHVEHWVIFFTFVFHVKHWRGFEWGGGETDIKNSIRICAVKKY